MVDDRDDEETGLGVDTPRGFDTATGEVIGSSSVVATAVRAAATPIPRGARLVDAVDVTRRDSPLARQRGESRPPPAAGARYRFGDVLGEGGMGEVLLAHDEHIGREVAVKRIRALDPTAEELARFVREACVQGRLEHPAVVPVHDLAVDRDGRPFFVMKRLSGTTMYELLGRLRSGGEPDGDAARRRLLRAFADVCLAVEFAHSRGIIHRDLKPANIMLGDFGEVYVLDWGVARALADDAEPGSPPSVRPFADLRLDTGDTLAGTVLGTPAYMAPEQLAGGRAGPEADIYALGCILFEIVAGNALHEPGRRAGMDGVAPVALPSLHRRDAPPELDAVCERATRVDPAQRFGSARALGAAVQAFLDGDRDVAARAALARHHIAAARAALAGGEGAEQRRAAIQAAGRALALDPTATEAADLVSHLMLRPPRHVPAEVEREIERTDTESARHQGRIAAVSMLGYLGFVPLLLWTGVREPAFVVAFAVLAAGSCAQLWVLTRRPDITRIGIYVNACTNAALIGLVAHMVGPFIIAPTLATTTLTAYAAHPKFGRITVMGAILGAAVAVPWLLELLGVVAPTYRFIGGELVLGSPVVRFASVPVHVAFAMLLIVTLTVVGVLSRGLAKRQRDATRALELQAWQLRQIVPSLPR